MSERGIRIRVAALIRSEGRILMVKQEKDGSAYWLLPGGNLEEGESLQEGLRREVREETGIETAPGELLAVAETISPERDVHILHLIFEATMPEGATPRACDSEESVIDIAFMSAAELIGCDVRPPIEEYLAELAGSAGKPAFRCFGQIWR